LGRTCESLRASPADWLEAIHPERSSSAFWRLALTKQLSGLYDEQYPDHPSRMLCAVGLKDRAFSHRGRLVRRDLSHRRAGGRHYRKGEIVRAAIALPETPLPASLAECATFGRGGAANCCIFVRMPRLAAAGIGKSSQQTNELHCSRFIESNGAAVRSNLGRP